MPNHVTNILTLKGHSDEIEKCFKVIQGVYEDGEKRIIDFNKIIPMPESLNIVSGTETDRGMTLLLNDTEKLKEMLDYAWAKRDNITDIESLRQYLLSTISEEGLKCGLKAIKNIKQYGHKDWYNWSIANWGTKWNAYQQSKLTPESTKFETAWSTPFPVMCKLSEMFPELSLEIYYADEDIGSNCGSYTLQSGSLIHEYCPDGYEATKFAYKVKGYEEIEDESDVIVESIGWIKKEELPKLKYDLVDFLNNSDVQTQKDYVDVLLNRMNDYSLKDEDKKEKYIFLLNTFLEHELYEVAQYLTERTKVTKEE